ncbi:hypothetical protein ACVBEQ_03100 [Nakamurella sp. GG22]
MFSTAQKNTASKNTASRTRRLLRQITGIIVATAAMLIGFAVAGSAATAHADTYAGDAYFTSTVECGGDALLFTVNSDYEDGSYAQIWVYDATTEEWVTDDLWVEANYDSTFNVADLTFETGYYMVYVAYAQWNGVDYDFSGEYIETYEQYYDYEYSETSDFCYMGNDLALAS